MKKALLSIVLLSALFASCEKKEGKSCYTCSVTVARSASHRVGNEVNGTVTATTEQVCDQSPETIRSYERVHSKIETTADSLFQTTVQCVK